MSSRSDHDMAGALVGGLSVFASAMAAGPSPSVGEVLGGVLSGVVTSRLPDVLEPATHPGHRRVAHSTVVLGATGWAATRLHKTHVALAAAADSETDPLRKFLAQVAGGATVGAAGGYASHLMLDATTPMGLPLLGV